MRAAGRRWPRPRRALLLPLATVALLTAVAAPYLGVGASAALLTDQAAPGANTVSTVDTYSNRVKALNPLGYWRLDEAAVANGTTAVDSSGNGRNGAYVAGDLYWQSTNTAYTSGNGYQYYALNVNATYTIQAGDQFEYDMFLNNGTYQQAVDFTTTGGVTLRDSGPPDQHGVSPHPTAVTSTNFQPNTWYHRVFGIPSGNALVGQTISTIMLANESDSAATQAAHFANIRITRASGTIVKSFWSAGDPVPTLTPKIVGPSAGTATVTSGSLWPRVTPGPLVIYGGDQGATRFGGDTNGVTLPDPALDMAARSAFTVELWVKSNAFVVPLPGSGLVCRMQAPGGGLATGLEQYCIDHFNNTVRFFVRDSGGPSHVLVGPNLNDNQWHHVVGVYNAGAMSLYVDGTQVATGTDPSGLYAEPAGTNTYIATRPGNLANSTGPAGTWGQVADVAIYPTALTPAQIQDHYLHH